MKAPPIDAIAIPAPQESNMNRYSDVSSLVDCIVSGVDVVVGASVVGTAEDGTLVGSTNVMADLGGTPPKFPNVQTPFCAAKCRTAAAACGPCAPPPINCNCCTN